jgi:hypothetical protein
MRTPEKRVGQPQRFVLVPSARVPRPACLPACHSSPCQHCLLGFFVCERTLEKADGCSSSERLQRKIQPRKHSECEELVGPTELQRMTLPPDKTRIEERLVSGPPTRRCFKVTRKKEGRNRAAHGTKLHS